MINPFLMTHKNLIVLLLAESISYTISHHNPPFVNNAPQGGAEWDDDDRGWISHAKPQVQTECNKFITPSSNGSFSQSPFSSEFGSM